MSMQLIVNGESEEFEAGVDLADLVAREAGEDPEHVAVAVNGEVIPEEEWPATSLAPEDEIEIVRPIQGG